jgi:hypothetical protein
MTSNNDDDEWERTEAEMKTLAIVSTDLRSHSNEK